MTSLHWLSTCLLHAEQQLHKGHMKFPQKHCILGPLLGNQAGNVLTSITGKDSTGSEPSVQKEAFQKMKLAPLFFPDTVNYCNSSKLRSPIISSVMLFKPSNLLITLN